MASYLITGSSRGIGLTLVSLLAAFPESVVGKIVATARTTESPALQKLAQSSGGRISIVKLVTTDKANIAQAVNEVGNVLGSKGLDVLVNNAGVMPITQGGIEAMDDLEDTLLTNVTGVHMVTKAFLPLLRKGDRKKVVNISTTLGSIAKAKDYALMPVPAYKISKSALNSLTVQYALQFAEEGFTFFAISPGWLQTDMGSKDADLPVETGATALLKAILETGKEQNGAFKNIKVAGWENIERLNQYDGLNLPW